MKKFLGFLTALVVIDIAVTVYCVYRQRPCFDFPAPVLLGVQVTLVSLAIIAGGIVLGFVGWSRMDDIQRQAIERASDVAAQVARKEVDKLRKETDNAGAKELSKATASVSKIPSMQEDAEGASANASS